MNKNNKPQSDTEAHRGVTEEFYEKRLCVPLCPLW